MKLTNDMKQAFAKKVVAAIPRNHTVTLSVAADHLQKLVNSAVPAEVKRLLKTYPNLLSVTSTRVRLVPDNHNLGHLEYSEMGVHINVPDIVDFTKIDVQSLKDSYVDHLKEEKGCQDMYCRVMHVAGSCTTLLRLRELLPELVEHMPIEEAAKVYLPVTTDNIISDLMKVGVKMAPKIKVGKPVPKKVAAKKAVAA